MHSDRSATQRVFAIHQGTLESVDFPSAATRLMLGGVRWGEASVPLTPAYWAAQTWMWQLNAPHHYRLGRTLADELLACLLGGYGIPAEVGLAAYDRLRNHLAEGGALTDVGTVEALLAAPLEVGGRGVRYRFARQKAAYVAAAFAELPAVDDTLDDLPLRDRLMRIRGIGPKTASWIVRNARSSDEVAILDIHILRAGRLMGIFDEHLFVERHYARLEAAYVGFADAIGTRASILDSVMWMTMRQLPFPSRAVRKTSPRRQRPDHQPTLTL